MSAPMKGIFMKHFHVNQRTKLLFIPLRQSTGYAQKQSQSDLTVTAKRKRRSLEEYQRKYKVIKRSKEDADALQVTKYYLENGLRKVYPYYFTFSTFVKERWFGRTVLDVYTKEFRRHSIIAEIQEYGYLTVNGERVPLDFILGPNMKVALYKHRHEMPVLDVPIEIIEDTDELLVINKPASIPVHPCGRYRYNSVIMLLKLELGYDNLRPYYRIDRLASGLLIFLKTTHAARKYVKQLQSRELYKEYVCRVDGEFPDGEVVCNEPIGPFPSRFKLNTCDPSGKPSLTVFTKLSYNGRTSVVKCVPRTGRTHQIRVHLMFLGYPISNDKLYKKLRHYYTENNTVQELEDDILEWAEPSKWLLGGNPRYYRQFGDNKNGQHSNRMEGQTEIGGRTNKLHQPVETSEDLANRENFKSVTSFSDLKVIDNSIVNVTKDFIKDFEHGTPDLRGNWESNKDIDNSSIRKDNSLVDCDISVNSRVDCDNSVNFGHERVVQKHPVYRSIGISEGISNLKNINSNSTDKTATTKETDVVEKVTDISIDESKVSVDELCLECPYLYRDPDPEDLIMYLHAVRYKGSEWEYCAPLPYWASEDFDETHYARR